MNRTHEVLTLAEFAVFWRRAATEQTPGDRLGALHSLYLIRSTNEQIMSTLSHTGRSGVPCVSSRDPASPTSTEPLAYMRWLQARFHQIILQSYNFLGLQFLPAKVGLIVTPPLLAG